MPLSTIRLGLSVKWVQYWRQGLAIYELVHWWLVQCYYRKSVELYGNCYSKILSLYRNIRKEFFKNFQKILKRIIILIRWVMKDNKISFWFGKKPHRLNIQVTETSLTSKQMTVPYNKDTRSCFVSKLWTVSTNVKRIFVKCNRRIKICFR